MDNIPPDVPTGLVGVYMNDQVNMFWNVTRAGDSAGFNIYRSEDPTGEFQQINSQPILQASYQDTTIEANKTYYYYVIAFDDATPINESQPSDVAVVETSTFE
jgi:fibronectin type 3 domain-containing protein